MTAPEVTPAVRRAMVVLGNQDPGWTRDALAAGLDVEEIARAMQGYAETKRIENPDALGHRPRQTWEETSGMNRQIFRERAAHLRTALLGPDVVWQGDGVRAVASDLVAVDEGDE